MIHTTTGVYTNGEQRHNGVPSEALAEHIRYNMLMRPGRAFFLDGICIHTGYLRLDEAAALEGTFPKLDKDTAPYL